MPDFTDEEFLTAKEKQKIFRAWRLFIRSGFTKEKFTKALYKHLHQNCGFIAHYSRQGFYYSYFDDLDSFKRFFNQFGGDKQTAELGFSFTEYITWGASPALDLNQAMIAEAEAAWPKVMQAIEMYESRQAKWRNMVPLDALRRIAPQSAIENMQRSLRLPFSSDLQALIAAHFQMKRKVKPARRQAEPALQMAMF